MITKLRSSIVRIYTSDGSVVGTGFLATERHILTCSHVVADALDVPDDIIEAPPETIQLDFPLVAPGQFLPGHIVHWQPETDIAGLEIESAPPDGAQPVRMVTASDLWEHPFRAYGFPSGYDHGVWASGVLRERLAAGWVQIEGVKETGYFVERGFSGGPVWDERLEGVVGMIVAADKEVSRRAAFIIPTDMLVTAWPTLDWQAIPPCPYRGLFAFREIDAPFFFGREAFTAKLVETVQRQSLVAVLGASGSGKSSVIFAGLKPRLRQKGNWIITDFRPGADPFKAISAVLLPLYETSLDKTDQLARIPKLATYLRNGDVLLADVISQILQVHSSDQVPTTVTDQPAHFLLIADQFEELYTLYSDPSVRRCFLDLLISIFSSPSDSSAFTFLFTLRADFLGQAMAYRPFADVLQDDLKLGPMTRDELNQVIERPAKNQGVTFEPGLIERVLDDVGDEPGNLPLLEFALTELWGRQFKGVLPHKAYEDIGRVKGALTHYADSVYGELSQTEQEQARRLFVQLVQPGEGTEDTRRLAKQPELREVNVSLVQKLADARLVITNRDEAGQETVEIVHEALIQEWGQMQVWMNEDRVFRAWQERLRVAINQWREHKEDPGALLRGAPLIQAQAMLREHPVAITPEERDFIEASQEMIELEKNLIVGDIHSITFDCTLKNRITEIIKEELPGCEVVVHHANGG